MDNIGAIAGAAQDGANMGQAPAGAPPSSLQADLAAVTAANTPTAVNPYHPMESNASLQADLAAVTAANKRPAPDAFRAPVEPSRLGYEDVRNYVEAKPDLILGLGASKIPNKDKVAYLNKFLQPGSDVSHLKDPVLDAIYNTAQLAQKDGYTPTIGAGTNGKHSENSSHYHGEAVDLSFKDSKGNYLNDTDMLRAGRRYGELAGWGSMRDEWTVGLPGNTYDNAHLHMDWGHGAGRKDDAAVTYFRNRDTATAEGMQPFNVDAASKAAQARPAGPTAKGLPDLAETVAKAVGIPSDMFVRQIQAESNFNPNAVSSVGARGLAQLTSETAAYLANKHGWTLQDLWASPTLQLRAGAEYMKENLQKFNGNQAQALAAYNMGPGGLQRVLDGHGSIPTETKVYVNKIMGPLDPTIATVDDATNNILTGNGAKWVPGAEHQQAQDIVLKASGAAQALMQKITGANSMAEFSKNWMNSYNDPNSPGSPLYNKSKLSVSPDGNPQDYVKGTINQSLDFMQDMANGLTMNLVPRSQRFKDVAAMGEGGDWINKGVGILGSGGQMVGGLALFEGAMAKLLGSAGGLFGGLNVARGAIPVTEGLLGSGKALAGTIPMQAYHSLLSVGAVSMMDGTVSSLAGWMRGEGEMKGMDPTQAVGHAFANGTMSALSAMAMMGFGTALTQAFPVVAEGAGSGLRSAIGAIVNSRSMPAQMALGGVLGTAGSTTGAAIFNATGLSQSVFGGDIPLPEAAFGGGVSGALMAPLAHYLPQHAASGEVTWHGLKEGGVVTEALRKGATRIMGGNPELVAEFKRQAMEQVATKTNGQNLAAGQLSLDSISKHVEGLQQTSQIAELGMQKAQQDVEHGQKMLEAYNQRKQGLEQQFPQDTQMFKQLSGLVDQAAQQAQMASQVQQAAGQDPKAVKAAANVYEQAVARLNKQMEAKTAFIAERPHLQEYGNADHMVSQLKPQMDQATAAFGEKQKDFQEKKLGFDHMLALSNDLAEGIKSGMAEWQAVDHTGNTDAAGALKVISSKLKDIISRPLQTDTIWNRSLTSKEFEHFNTPEGLKVRGTLYQNYRENFMEGVMKSIQGAADLGDVLSTKTNQAVKMLSGNASGENAGVGPYVKSTYEDIQKASQFLEEQLKSPEHQFKPYSLTMQDGAGHRTGWVDTMHSLAARAKFRYDAPLFETYTKADGAIGAKKGVKAKDGQAAYGDVLALPTDFLMTSQNMAEALGTAKPLNSDGFFKRLGTEGNVQIPTIKTAEDFQQLLIHAKAADSVGQDFVPFKGDAKTVARLAREYVESVKPTSEKLTELKNGLTKYTESLKSLPIAQRPGFDLSRAFNPDYASSNIHESFRQLGQYDDIAKAMVSGDKGAIQKVIQNEQALFQANLADIALTDSERVGIGRYNQDKNSQAVVLGAEHQNRELGLTLSDSGVTHSPIIEQILNTIYNPGGADAITLDKANQWRPDKTALTLNAQQSMTVDETIRQMALGGMRGRSVGDIRGLVAIQYGNSVYAHRQGWNMLAEKLMGPFESLIKEASGEVRGDRSRADWKGLKERGLTPEGFKKELIAVQEDSSKYPEFAAKYKDIGKTALYYSNKIKGVLETITAGNPDLKNYMRANYVAASFPKYTDYWLKTQASTPGANLRTGLSSENIREFSTREALQKHIQQQKDRVSAKGLTMPEFKDKSLRERIEILHPDALGGRTSEELLAKDRDRYDQLVRDTEMVTQADLFDMTDDDPVSVFRRQMSSMFRAQETRQLMNVLSNTTVDIGGRKDQPKQQALLRVMDPGEKTFSVHTYADGKQESFIAFSSIPGMDAFTTEVNGRTVRADEIEVHPEVYGFLKHTAIQDPAAFSSSGVVANWKRMIGVIRGYSLMGGWLPHMRNNMAMRMGETVLTPLRAFAADSAGRHMIDGANRDMQLATFNAVRSGVNMRTIAEASRGIMQATLDQMGPEAANRMAGVANDTVGKFLQAMNVNDPANKAAYNQLGGLLKFGADVLGAPVTMDHIMMREGAHKNIQAGMIGGFYHTREILRQKHASDLAGLDPEARNRTLDQMASQLTNHKASALPFYMQSTTFREAFGNTFMSPNWLQAKAHMVIDFLDYGLGLTTKIQGKALSPDQLEASSLLHKMGISDRKYAGYSPEVKQALRARMATTLAGSMFASFIGLQVFQHMIDGTDTLHGRAPDKWGALKVGDRYMSGLVAGNVKDVVDFATAGYKGPAPLFEKLMGVIERNLLPTDRAIGELASNKDGSGKPIYGDYRDEPVAAAAFARDVTGYMAKSFVNFDDTLGYKSNTQISDMVGNVLAGPGGVAPNSMTGKEYILRMLGAYDAKDNWAGSVRADLQHRQSFYKQDLERRVQPFLDAAKMETNPEKRDAYTQAGWALANKGLPIIDEELSRYSPDGRYRLTSKMYMEAFLRTMDPEAFAARQERQSMAGHAFAQQLSDHVGGQEPTQ